MQLDEVAFRDYDPGSGEQVVTVDVAAARAAAQLTATQNGRAETGIGLVGPYTQMATYVDTVVEGTTVTVIVQPTPRFYFIGRLVGTEGWFPIPVVSESAQLQYGITGVENP
jgi:hypothetical protein